MKLLSYVAVGGVLLVSATHASLQAETGYEAWLRYAPLADSARLLRLHGGERCRPPEFWSY